MMNWGILRNMKYVHISIVVKYSTVPLKRSIYLCVYLSQSVSSELVVVDPSHERPRVWHSARYIRLRKIETRVLSRKTLEQDALPFLLLVCIA